MTKCPKCEQTISRVSIKELDGVTSQKTWRCISYNCPLCHTSLGVQIDPIAIKVDIINSLQRG